MRRVAFAGLLVLGLAVLWALLPTGGPQPELDVIYQATPPDIVEKMLELADVRPGDVVYDLGCGDGRIPVAAARKYGVRAFGFDLDPERVRESLANVARNKVEHLVTIKQQDIFELDLSRADVVTLYLLPELNVKLIPQLQKLKPGSRIVSHEFAMKGVTPTRMITVQSQEPEPRPHTLYLWVTPLQR